MRVHFVSVSRKVCLNSSFTEGDTWGEGKNETLTDGCMLRLKKREKRTSTLHNVAQEVERGYLGELRYK